MKPPLRIDFVNRLVRGIEQIGPVTLFEPFGGAFMHHWLKVSLVHTGINLLNDPISGVVDTVSADGGAVAEYSADKNYFVGKMPKARSDLTHALDQHPSAETIFLASSQIAPAKRRKAIVRLTAGCKKKHGVLVEVLDARRIAEVIVDELLFIDLAVDRLSEYVPQLRHIQDEFASSDGAPEPAAHYVQRPSVQNAIASELAVHNAISLVGLAGNGKSESAAAFARDAKSNVDLVIWLNASEMRNLSELKSRTISRVGEERNVATLLKSHTCLLVLDDLQIEAPNAQLAALSGPKSKIIITRRTVPMHGAKIILELMTEQEATALLNSGGVTACPPSIVATVLSTVGGHPFTLALINAAVLSGGLSWKNVEADCENGKAASFADAQQRVADRLLARLVPLLKTELEVFCWVRTSRCDRGFLRYVCGHAGLMKLKQHCLVSADLGYVVRLHDIVFASIQASVGLSPATTSGLLDKLCAYIESVAYADDIAFTALSFALANKLAELVASGVSRSSVRYAWLRSWDAYARDISQLGNAAEQARELATRATPPNRLDVAVILEVVEITYRSLKSQEGTSNAKGWLKQSLAPYDILEGIAGLEPRSKAEITHHRGKALNLTNDREGAIQAFESVLSGPNPLHETRLQLVRLYARDRGKSERAVELATEVFEAAINNPADVTSSVLLAVAEALPWGKLKGVRRKFMARYGDLLEERLIAMAEAGSDQVYQSFASIGRDWAWHDPDRYARIFPSIPKRALGDTKRDDERFAYADILREGAETAVNEEAQKERLRAESLQFFEAIEKPSAFQQQKLGQLLVEWGRFAEAIEKLQAINPQAEDRFRKLWLSKAYLGVERKQEAFDLIDAVVTATPGDDTFASTFLAQRFEARRALNDANAVEDLRRAIAHSTSNAPRARLERRLSDVEASSSAPG